MLGGTDNPDWLLTDPTVTLIGGKQMFLELIES